MYARRTGIITCRSCLGTRGGQGCESCKETGVVLCDECSDIYPYAAAEWHTEVGELCDRCKTNVERAA